MSETLRLECGFCAFACRLAPGQAGRCGVRRHNAGRLVTEGRDQTVALAIDPVEKKPLYHVRPGSRTLSVALFGCNYRCRFCQNAHISQAVNRGAVGTRHLPAADLAAMMADQGLASVSFTYSEPSVWQDWMIDAARAVKAVDGQCYMVTNGSFSPAAREGFAGLIDAYNIDVKGDEAFYRDYCSAELSPVMANVAALCREQSAAVEVCTLLIEGVHRITGVLELGKRLADAGLQVWHLSRFFPAWKMMDHPPTSEAFLEEALAEVRAKLAIPFVYPGNSSLSAKTLCPGCGELLIERKERAGKLKAESGRCPRCGRAFPICT